MSVLYVALPIALLLGGSALLACIYCIRQGQYDDLETPAVRILIDDPIRPANAINTQDESQDLTERLT